MEKKFLEKWLKDAYAMEQNAIEMLGKQEEKLNNYPQGRARIREHLEETRWQAQQLEDCLHKIGANPSGFKDMVGKVTGNLSAMSISMAEDETLKNLIAGNAFENFEVACYTSLIAAAEECGLEEIKEVCEKILEQEEAMAQWFKDEIGPATRQFLSEKSGAVR